MTTALITGASTGIGAAFAQELATRKTNLVLVARSLEKLQQLATQLQTQYQISVEVIAQDLTAPQAGQAVFDTLASKGMAIDLLVNNAGFGEYGDFIELDRERQLNMIQLNILALVDLTHQFLPGMRQRRSGNIINMSSVAAFQSMPYFSVYAATKSFILSFSEALWAENRQYGVRIIAVCPGPTDTSFFKDAEFPSILVNIAEKNYTSTEVVVREALAALAKEHPVVVPGDLRNQILANVPRFLPREAITTFWKTVLGRRK
ncbi:SDR family NAD(P)-dependent oxidoreductase [Gloeocapsopsis dulcis]|uniref:Oxidoreductase n=1 Tax=Gloeocapsopsis dulcis AAB1 = 1H9 TaxID=1433147 RepID=A0A6N8G287_9CHRO|nr:SDR family oxidoreductase [Gloeocapsopsis dulcis]MUL39301.1 oxidoreductase [Gloeocapsopsis dulcis AAB1 = 1H9]WNN87936.1 SDR family oxidoreductase [Gloeocapsopsis dulcis]